MGELLLPALALMLVLEGILPLAAPQAWRNVMRQVAEMRDGQIRFIGLLSIVAGGTLLAIVR